MEKNKLLLKKSILLLITMLIFFVFCEIVLRIFSISSGYDYPKGMYQEDNLLGYSMTPNFKGELVKPEFKTSIYTNSQGLRDGEYDKKGKDEFRILGIGDSCTWGGYGTELEDTYLKLLEKRLNRLNGKTFSVINSGVPGYNTMQEYLYLKERGIGYEPNMVLLTFALNDFIENPTNWKDIIIKNGVKVTTKKDSSFLKVRSFLLINFWSYRTIERGVTILFNNYAQKFWFKREVKDDPHLEIFLKNFSPDTDKKFDLTFSILDDMNAFLKERNISFAIIVMPLKYQVDGSLKQELIEVNNLDINDLDFEKPQAMIKIWAKNNDALYIDILPILKSKNKDNDFYWDLNPHFNKKGNEEVANIIFNKFEEGEIHTSLGFS